MNDQNNLQNYLKKMKQIQKSILEYLEGDENLEKDCENLIMILKNSQIQSDRKELKSLLHLIVSILNNHHRSPNFLKKIELILENFQNEIKNFYSNDEIFNIFKDNKRILLFLLNQKIIIPNYYIASILELPEYQQKHYPQYFFPEFKTFFNAKLIKKVESEISKLLENLELFEEKRENGENDDSICKMIRNDSIEDFIFHINTSNISLSSEIKPSIFETNAALIGKSPTIIEYSAFFGSVNIFKYLYLNKIELESSIWNLSIHGQNSDLIHLLEEVQSQSLNDSCEQYFYESIKCHHNEIANYIQNNFLSDFDNFDMSLIIESYNFEFFPYEMSNDFDTVFCLCNYDHFNIVQFLLKNIDFNINDKKVFSLLIFI